MMELRPRKNEVLRCGYCLEDVTASDAIYLKERGSESRFATLAVHGDCNDELKREHPRFVKAPLAYGLAKNEQAIHSLPVLTMEDMESMDVPLQKGVIELDEYSPDRLAFRANGQCRGVVLNPMQITAKQRLIMVNQDNTFINVYESLAIKASDAKLRLCLHDSLGLKIVRALVFSGGRQLKPGSYHSSSRMSQGLVTLDCGGVVSVVYDQGDFVDVEGGITLSKPPSNLPKHMQPHMPSLKAKRRNSLKSE